MKNKYFNEREKRLFNFFSNKDDYYKGCYFGETNPLIDNKINKIEKRYVSDFKKQLKKTKDKHEQNYRDWETANLVPNRPNRKGVFLWKVFLATAWVRSTTCGIGVV